MENRNESLRLLLIQILITGSVCFIIAQFTGLGNEFAFKAGICFGALNRLWRSYQVFRQNRI